MTLAMLAYRRRNDMTYDEVFVSFEVIPTYIAMVLLAICCMCGVSHLYGIPTASPPMFNGNSRPQRF